MLVMTYSDARAHFSDLLNRVKEEGAAIVRRADGSSFRIIVEEDSLCSPFEQIQPILPRLSCQEILDTEEEARQRADWS